jgi:hypothetical protein
MGLKKGQTNSGSFKKVIAPKTKGRRTNIRKCQTCGIKIDFSDKRIKNCKKCGKTHDRKYKVSVREKGDGYIKIRINGKDNLLHKWIWECNFGKIDKDYIVHHIDGNKRNNNINNLTVLSRSDHIRLHNIQQLKNNPNRKYWGINRGK